MHRTNAGDVIVFVHGLFGDAESTWTNAKTQSYWPRLLAGDAASSSSDVFVFSFQSPFFGQASPIDALVEQMYLELTASEVFSKHKRVIFVCHSMGGIVTRKLLTRY